MPFRAPKTFAFLFFASILSGAATAAPLAAPLATPTEFWVPRARAQAQNITSQAVVVAPIDTLITGLGRVQIDPARLMHVVSPVSGKVAKIVGELGQHVAVGQTLATIISPDMAQARSDHDKATADLTATAHDLARQRALSEAKAASAQDLELAKDAFEHARAEAARAHMRLQLLGGNEAAPDHAETYVLKSRIAGEVMARQINPGSEIQGQYAGGSATELFTVADLHHVWVMADIDEVEIDQIAIGEPAQISYPSNDVDKRIMGTIDWLAAAVDPQTHTLKVRIRCDNQNMALRPEMYVTCQVKVKGRDTLVVPRQAIGHIGFKQVVFMDVGDADKEARHFVRRPVIVDEDVLGNALPILHGLSQGDSVVVEGVDFLLDQIK